MGRVFTPDIGAQVRLPNVGARLAYARPCPSAVTSSINQPAPQRTPVGQIFTPDIGPQARLLPRRGVARPRPPLPLRRNIEYQPTSAPTPPVGRVFTPVILDRPQGAGR